MSSDCKTGLNPTTAGRNSSASTGKEFCQNDSRADFDGFHIHYFHFRSFCVVSLAQNDMEAEDAGLVSVQGKDDSLRLLQLRVYREKR